MAKISGTLQEDAGGVSHCWQQHTQGNNKHNALFGFNGNAFNIFTLHIVTHTPTTQRKALSLFYGNNGTRTRDRLM